MKIQLENEHPVSGTLSVDAHRPESISGATCHTCGALGSRRLYRPRYWETVGAARETKYIGVAAVRERAPAGPDLSHKSLVRCTRERASAREGEREREREREGEREREREREKSASGKAALARGYISRRRRRINDRGCSAAGAERPERLLNWNYARRLRKGERGRGKGKSD